MVYTTEYCLLCNTVSAVYNVLTSAMARTMAMSGMGYSLDPSSLSEVLQHRATLS